MSKTNGNTRREAMDVGARLDELEERIAVATRNLARLGWTEAALAELTQEPVLLCGSAPRLREIGGAL